MQKIITIWMCLPVCACFFFARADAQPLVISFAHNSAAVTETYSLRIMEAPAGHTASGPWNVEGKASSPGTPAHNLALSQKRAEAVARILRSAGIPAADIRLVPQGERLSDQTGDNPADRVAVIHPPAVQATPPPSSPLSASAAETRWRHIDVYDGANGIRIAGSARSEDGKTWSFGPSGLDLSPGGAAVRFISEGFRDTVLYVPPGTGDFRVEMLPPGVLEKLSFRNIYFYPNTADIVPESYRAMEELYKKLENRGQVHIQIRGHVNWPSPMETNADTERYLQSLSEQRARAVMRWLVKKGIPPEHLSAAGFGNTQMLFPKAVTEAEQAQNRRVEILILKE